MVQAEAVNAKGLPVFKLGQNWQIPRINQSRKQGTFLIHAYAVVLIRYKVGESLDMARVNFGMKGEGSVAGRAGLSGCYKICHLLLQASKLWTMQGLREKQFEFSQTWRSFLLHSRQSGLYGTPITARQSYIAATSTDFRFFRNYSKSHRLIKYRLRFGFFNISTRRKQIYTYAN